MAFSYQGMSGSESGGEDSDSVFLPPSPPALMKDARNYGREQPVRSTRKEVVAYREMSSPTSSMSSVAKVFKRKSKNAAAGQRSRKTRKVLTAKRKRLIEDYLGKAKQNPLRFRGQAGMKILKEELLTELRALASGASAVGQIGLLDVNRWLKTFSSAMNDIIKRADNEFLSQATAAIQSGINGVTHTIIPGPSSTVSGPSPAAVPGTSSSAINGLALFSGPAVAIVAGYSAATSGELPARSAAEGSESEPEFRPPPPSSVSSISTERFLPADLQGISLNGRSEEMDNTTSGLSSGPSPRTDDEYNGQEQGIYAAAPERNQTVEYAADHTGGAIQWAGVKRSHHQDLRAYYARIITQVNTMKADYREFMETQKVAHACLQVYCHFLNSLTAFIQHYMDQNEDPHFPSRAHYY